MLVLTWRIGTYFGLKILLLQWVDIAFKWVFHFIICIRSCCRLKKTISCKWCVQMEHTKTLTDGDFHWRSCFNFKLCPLNLQNLTREIPTDMKVLRSTLPGQKMKRDKSIGESEILQNVFLSLAYNDTMELSWWSEGVVASICGHYIFLYARQLVRVVNPMFC